MAIKDEGTFHLKQAARDMLRRLGSKRSQQIGWRDMWAFVTIKGSSSSTSSAAVGTRKAGFATGMLGTYIGCTIFVHSFVFMFDLLYFQLYFPYKNFKNSKKKPYKFKT